MLFGFGKGKIDIVIEKYNYSPGETVKGKLILNLKETVHAKSLKVGIVGEKTTTVTLTINGKTNTRHSNVNVFSFEMPLDGEKDYVRREYDFEMKVPGNLTQPSIPEGVAGDILKSVQILAGREGTIKWYITAKLDVPKGFDVSNRVQVNIG